jgi:hypothetical protein
MCYFFILFNRIDEALELFQRIQEMSLSSTCGGSQLQVQYDYMDAYLDFYRRFPLDGSSSSILFPIARQHAKRYESYPQARWSLRFKKIRDLLDEYDAFARRNKVTTISATVNDQDVKMVDVETEADDNTSLQLEAEVEKDQVQIITQNIGACELSFYPIDVELMFSTEPFDTFSDAATSASSLLLIEPRLKIHVPLLKGNETKATCTVQIPSELKSLQMMVRIQEVVSTRKKTSIQAPSDLIRSYFNTSLQVVFLKQKGVLQVLQQGNPVQSCYVKVYVKTNELGQTRNYQRKKAEFYKDGYTDIMGKFDYISINGDLIERVNKFSVLVSHVTYGAVVKQVYPPVLASTSTDFREKNREMLLY